MDRRRLSKIWRHLKNYKGENGNVGEFSGKQSVLMNVTNLNTLTNLPKKIKRFWKIINSRKNNKIDGLNGGSELIFKGTSISDPEKSCLVGNMYFNDLYSFSTRDTFDEQFRQHVEICVKTYSSKVQSNANSRIISEKHLNGIFIACLVKVPHLTM